jgi:hypothetical protein
LPVTRSKNWKIILEIRRGNTHKVLNEVKNIAYNLASSKNPNYREAGRTVIGLVRKTYQVIYLDLPDMLDKTGNEIFENVMGRFDMAFQERSGRYRGAIDRSDLRQNKQGWWIGIGFIPKLNAATDITSKTTWWDEVTSPYPYTPPQDYGAGKGYWYFLEHGAGPRVVVKPETEENEWWMSRFYGTGGYAGKHIFTMSTQSGDDRLYPEDIKAFEHLEWQVRKDLFGQYNYAKQQINLKCGIRAI